MAHERPRDGARGRRDHPGKRVIYSLLSSGVRKPPEQGDDPILRQAWQESRSLAVAWRIVYSMPPNDPRFLDMTDEDMAHDLLLVAYRNLNSEMEQGTEAGERARRRTASARSAMLRLTQKAESPDFQAALRRAEAARLRGRGRTVVKEIRTKKREPAE